MDNTKKMQKGIALLEKQISLRQIAIRSGINYITLRKIKSGETKNVSSGVMARFEAFQQEFDPSTVAAKKKPGPKPKAAAAKKKPGPKPKADAAAAAAPAKKKPGPKPKAKTADAAVEEAPAKKKAGRPKKSAAAKKTAGKRGRKPGPKPVTAPKVVADKATNFGSPLLGEALTREIEIAEARIEYLKSLQMVEEEFLRAIGKK